MHIPHVKQKDVMTSVVDLRDEKDYTEERRASIAAHGENIQVSVDGRGTGRAEEGRKESGPPWRCRGCPAFGPATAQLFTLLCLII